MGILHFPPMHEQPAPRPREWAIAASYSEFLRWRNADHHTRRHVSYLTRERAELELARGAEKGTLHRLPGWEESPAREAAEQLEAN